MTEREKMVELMQIINDRHIKYLQKLKTRPVNDLQKISFQKTLSTIHLLNYLIIMLESDKSIDELIDDEKANLKERKHR